MGRLDKDFGGHVAMLGGACISASANRNKIKAQSSPESELYAYCQGCKTLVFHQMLLEFLSIKLKLPTPVYADLTGVLAYVQKLGVTSLNKHFAKFPGLARDQQLNLVSVAVHMAGDNQIATYSRRPLPRSSSSSYGPSS